MNITNINIPIAIRVASFIIALIIILLSFIAIIKDIRVDKNKNAISIAIATIFVFSIHLISYSIFYNFYTNVVASIILIMLVGLPYAVVSMSVVLLAETIFLGNGSIYTIGLNIIIIAIMIKYLQSSPEQVALCSVA